MLKFSSALVGTIFVALLGFAGVAPAQPAYPTKPIRFIVPYPPGGSTDPMARFAALHLSERWGQPIVVDNRPGGNTIIGTEAVAKAPKDGYTILLASTALLTTPSLIARLPYDVLRDFTGIATIAKSRFVLVIPTSNPSKNLQELIAYIKARPGQINYASSGVGANTHLSAALFSLMIGTRMNHIPYKGSGTLQADLMAGRVDLSFQVPISVIPHIKAGKMRAIAITGETRAAALPDVPTFAEAGMPKFQTGGWFGIVAPSGTPKYAIDKMSREMASILATPDAEDYLVKQGSEAFISTPEQVNGLMKADVAKFAKIIKEAGIKAEQ
jgi:tripartite-type tricarboxylate transporter receptor subunit TctC